MKRGNLVTPEKLNKREYESRGKGEVKKRGGSKVVKGNESGVEIMEHGEGW